MWQLDWVLGMLMQQTCEAKQKQLLTASLAQLHSKSVHSCIMYALTHDALTCGR